MLKELLRNVIITFNSKIFNAIIFNTTIKNEYTSYLKFHIYIVCKTDIYNEKFHTKRIFYVINSKP